MPTTNPIERDLELKAGDTLPAATGTLADTTGAPVDLTAATSVRFRMRSALGGAVVVDAQALVVDPDAGTVRYAWQAGDTDLEPGVYLGEWLVSFGTDSFTAPGGPYLRILVTPRVAS